MKLSSMHLALIAAGTLAAYYLGRQSGIKDQKAADAAGTNLLGQATQTPGALAGTTAIPGESWAKSVGLTPAAPAATS